MTNKYYYPAEGFGYDFDMSLVGARNFTTLVMASVLATAVAQLPGATRAATPPPQPNLDDPASSKEVVEQQPDPVITETISITPPPPAPEGSNEEESEYFFRFRQGLTARVGMLYDTKSDRETAGSSVTVGALYALQDRRLQRYEFGADLIADGTGRVHGARRWLFSRTRVRHYAKAGLGVKLVPDEGLTTFIRLRNLQARGAIGFENLIREPFSFRAELEAAASVEDLEIIATVGAVWHW